MGVDFPDLRDGVELEPFHINIIYRELRRWLKFTAAAPLNLSGMDGDGAPLLTVNLPVPIFIKLTGTFDMASSSYPWKEVLIGANYTISDSGMTGSAASGDAAYERQTGDTSLTVDGTIYEARRSLTSGAGWYFDGKN